MSFTRTFELMPAIDLRSGRVVRLRHGHDDERTTYDTDLAQTLGHFARSGVTMVHVVDLDAAFGEPAQHGVLSAMLALRERPAIQLGGGLRDRATIGAALADGCARVVVGSLVARQPGLFRDLALSFPGRLVPALDVETVAGLETVRVAGWRADAPLELDALCESLRGLPCAGVLVTDIGRDGTLEGPNFELARRVGAATELGAFLSGGVRSLEDIRAARQAKEIRGVIVGKALWEGHLPLDAAIAAAQADMGEAGE